MILKFDTKGNDKQKEVCRLWVDSITTDIVYGGSKGCFAAGTMILTEFGYKPIEKILQGERVYSYNEFTKKTELKSVIKTFTYGGGIQSKMITFVLSNGTQIKCTDNHEFYTEGIWQPASRLAGRIMGIRTKYEQPVSNIKQGQINDYPAQEFTQSRIHEAVTNTRLCQDIYFSQRQNKANQDTQVSRSGFYTESTKQTTSEPHRLRPIKQPRRKFRVGDTLRKHEAQQAPIRKFQKRVYSAKPMQRIEGVEFKANRRASERNTSEVQAESLYKGNVSKGIWSSGIDNQRCNTSPVEAREINLDEIVNCEISNSFETVYDLCVADNHNYLLNDGIIVHNSGKSYLGVSLIFGDAFIYPGTSYFIARKSLTNIRKFTIPSIHEVFGHWGINSSMWKYNGQDNYYELYNGSRVYLLDAKYLPSDPEYYRFGSMQMTRGWIEEAGEFEEAAKNNLAASIGRWKNDVYNLKPKLLQTCNPAKNYLYREYYIPSKNGTIDPWKKFVQALPHDNKCLPDGYLENLERSLSPNERERLLKGNWEIETDASALIDYNKIIDTFSNNHVPSGKKCITGDMARLGGDKIVIIEWDGFRGHIRFYQKQDLATTAQLLEAARSRLGCGKSDILVDEDGLGGGVVDFYKCKGFVNNAKPYETRTQRDLKGQPMAENFDHAKSQCYYKLAERINNNGLYLTYDDDRVRDWVIQELEQVKQKKLDSDMKKGVIPKDKVKELIGRSPDFADAIMMREAFELMPKFVFVPRESW